MQRTVVCFAPSNRAAKQGQVNQWKSTRDYRLLRRAANGLRARISMNLKVDYHAGPESRLRSKIEKVKDSAFSLTAIQWCPVSHSLEVLA